MYIIYFAFYSIAAEIQFEDAVMCFVDVSKLGAELLHFSVF